MSTAPPETFEERCSQIRETIKIVAQEVKGMHAAPIFLLPEQDRSDHPEMHENITLAYRHLEDARMRLGKAVQACDGGKSIYDK